MSNIQAFAHFLDQVGYQIDEFTTPQGFDPMDIRVCDLPSALLHIVRILPFLFICVGVVWMMAVVAFLLTE
jgi:hypothetical protein